MTRDALDEERLVEDRRHVLPTTAPGYRLATKLGPMSLRAFVDFNPSRGYAALELLTAL